MGLIALDKIVILLSGHCKSLCISKSHLKDSFISSSIFVLCFEFVYED